MWVSKYGKETEREGERKGEGAFFDKMGYGAVILYYISRALAPAGQ